MKVETVKGFFEIKMSKRSGEFLSTSEMKDLIGDIFETF